jgi:NAD(P)H-hydrate epimerase
MKTYGGVVFVTADEMASVDRAAIEEYGMDVLVLMENAGRGAAVVARRMLGGSVAGRRVGCLVGKGNNGGDGMVAARYLHNWGAQVSVTLASGRSDVREAPYRELKILERMGVEVDEKAEELESSDLLVDGLLGYNAKGDPREPSAGLIRRANASGAPILAVDLPSGLNASSGTTGDPCVVADATVTFGLPKTGFLNQDSRRFVGELYLADISIPAEAYVQRFHWKPDFGAELLAKIW